MPLHYDGEENYNMQMKLLYIKCFLITIDTLYKALNYHTNEKMIT